MRYWKLGNLDIKKIYESCEIRLLWSLYNYRCDKFIWVIKKIKKKKNNKTFDIWK